MFHKIVIVHKYVNANKNKNKIKENSPMMLKKMFS